MFSGSGLSGYTSPNAGQSSSFFLPTSPMGTSMPLQQQHHFNQYQRQTPPFQHQSNFIPTALQSSHRYSRKSDEFEPMNTSPILSNQMREFMPSYLTGEPHLQTSLKTATTPPSPDRRRPAPGLNTLGHTNLFTSTPDKRLEQDKEEVIQKQGPPTSGIGRMEEKDIFSPLLSMNKSTGFVVSNCSTNCGSFESFQGPYGKAIPLKSATSTWVTVFGFPTSSTSNILSHFSQYGTILEYRTNPGSNWVHLKYSNTIEARRALYKNGTIISGTMMVGVMSSDEETTKAPPAQFFKSPSQGSLGVSSKLVVGVEGSQNQKENVFPSKQSATSTPTPLFKGRIRSMGRDVEKVEMHVPKESSSFVSWALDTIFGW